MSVRYQDHLDGIGAAMLDGGFFEGWPAPWTPEDHLAMLSNSEYVWLAIDGGMVIGFINALSDGVHAGFVPLLEVLPSHRHRGIGSQLVDRMLASLAHLRAVDLVCDDELVPFYERFGLRRHTAMIVRRPGV